jgi:hypothetical protein
MSTPHRAEAQEHADLARPCPPAGRRLPDDRDRETGEEEDRPDEVEEERPLVQGN